MEWCTVAFLYLCGITQHDLERGGTRLMLFANYWDSVFHCQFLTLVCVCGHVSRGRVLCPHKKLLCFVFCRFDPERFNEESAMKNLSLLGFSGSQECPELRWAKGKQVFAHFCSREKRSLFQPIPVTAETICPSWQLFIGRFLSWQGFCSLLPPSSGLPIWWLQFCSAS